MRAGEVIAGRFEIEAIAGTGGMGVVYRARDAHTGDTVAVKMLRGEPDDAARGRFVREAKLLFDLSHPGLVRYVGHGTTPLGDLFIAMEWLDGEDLHTRLKRDGLSIAETVVLGARVARSLAFAHARGVVHRDIKPRNLWLAGGEVSRVKILDFGIAHLSVGTQIATQTGVLGTPGYMSPEQARGEAGLDARADLFSLGCVLHHCLVGRAPFAGNDMLAVAAKLLLEDAPRVDAFRADVPVELSSLVDRLLSKDPAARPASAEEVARVLDDLPTRIASGPFSKTRAKEPSAALTGEEQRTVCVVVATPAERAEAGGAELSRSDTERLVEIARSHGAALERLRDGGLVAILGAHGSATDQALSGVRCAQALLGELASFRFAVALGRGVVTGGLPVGEVIERAAALLRMEVDPLETPAVVVDEPTAALIGEHFELDTQATAHGTRRLARVRRERSLAARHRTLLGRRMPCFGRERELTTLDATLTECIEESVARAVLVTGAPGVGKTRVLAEFLSNVQSKTPEVAIFGGRADPMSAGSSFGLLGQVVRSALDVRDGDALETRRGTLVASVERAVDPRETMRVSAFLGELAGVPAPPGGEIDGALRAARQHPVLMGDQMQRAFEDYLAGRAKASPIVLVLEDLHWGDLPTTRFIDGALRNLRDKPLLVLALARPDVHALFPSLWLEHAVTEIRLSGLGKKAAERLVAEALGPGASADRVQHIVERAEGNAFFLEELVRAVADGRDDGSLPETVLATVEARILELPHEARRVLRAASVFGTRFWRGGVEALLGGEGDALDVVAWIRSLEDRELCVRRPSSRFAGDAEYVFRHALVRETAYAALTDTDRALGHRLAADWLARVGEEDALLLAEHKERGGRRREAVRHYRVAAAQALEGNDLEAAVERATRGLDAGAVDDDRAWLLLYAAEALAWRGQFTDALERATLALRHLDVSKSELSLRLAYVSAVACGRLGEVERVEELAHELRGVDPDPDAPLAYFEALSTTGEHIFYAGNLELGEALVRRMEQCLATIAPDPSVLAQVYRLRSTQALVRAQQEAALRHQIASASAFEEVGDYRQACQQKVNVGDWYAELGALEDAETALLAAMQDAERMGLDATAAIARLNLGRTLFRAGRLEEAALVLRRALGMLRAQKSARLESAGFAYLAQVLAAEDDLDAALDAADDALDIATAPPERAYARAIRAFVLLALRRDDEAAREATTAVTMLDEMGGIDEGELLIRLAFARSLAATRRGDEARAAIRFAHDRLATRLASIESPALRASCLARIPEHAEVARLATEWIGLAPPG